MFKALLKKQLMEVNTWLIQDKKSGKKRSTGKIIANLILWIVILGSLGFVFYFVGDMLCEPLVALDLGWMYLVMMSLMAIFLGIFGSVFNTYATLYQAKDNELLLSMPIQPSLILTVRLIGVWMWGFIYAAIVLIPALIVYWRTLIQYQLVSVGVILADLLLLILISVFVLTLSCILGWVVAKISMKLKGKSIVTVILSLAFIIVYYWGYSRAYVVLQNILANAATIGAKIKGAAYPLYIMGYMGEGDLFSTVLFTGCILLLFFATWLVLSRSFLKMATTTTGFGKKAYKEKVAKKRTPGGALYVKELLRFTSSSNYMLNCGLGTLFLPAVGIFLVVKQDFIKELYPLGTSLLAMILCAAVCMMSSMNDITAPSVSLEGKNIWLPQSLPVSSWSVLKAKLFLHFSITIVPTVFCAICSVCVLQPSFLLSFFMIVLPVIFVILTAMFGLAVNLKTPNLKWTNETIAVKQSIGVLLSMMGGWIFIFALGTLYYFAGKHVSVETYLGLCTVLVLLLSAALFFWLKKRGTRIFESL